MSRDTMLSAIVGEKYLLLEKEDVIVYKQDSSIFQVMPEIVVVLPRISAPRPTPRSDSAPLRSKRVLNPSMRFCRWRHSPDALELRRRTRML